MLLTISFARLRDAEEGSRELDARVKLRARALSKTEIVVVSGPQRPHLPIIVLQNVLSVTPHLSPVGLRGRAPAALRPPSHPSDRSPRVTPEMSLLPNAGNFVDTTPCIRARWQSDPARDLLVSDRTMRRWFGYADDFRPALR